MRILLVEDEISLTELVKARLQANNFVVDVEHDGLTGLKRAQINAYDLIIVDYMLPTLSGKNFCSELRKDNKTTAILVLSAVSEVEDKVEFLNSGADDYMTKPFHFEELLARIGSLLRRSTDVMEEKIKIGGFVLDLSERAVYKKGKEVPLTRKEFMLLEYLSRNKNKIITPYILMQHVWGEEVDPFTKTVKTHISNIRSKIDTRGKDSLIETVQGRGYRINTNN